MVLAGRSVRRRRQFYSAPNWPLALVDKSAARQRRDAGRLGSGQDGGRRQHRVRPSSPLSISHAVMDAVAAAGRRIGRQRRQSDCCSSVCRVAAIRRSNRIRKLILISFLQFLSGTICTDICHKTTRKIIFQ